MGHTKYTCLTLLGDARLFTKVILVIFSSSSGEYRFIVAPHSCQHLVLSNFSIFTIWVDVKSFLLVVLISIFLMPDETNEIEYRLMAHLYFPLMTLLVFIHFLLGCLSFS